MIQSFFWKFRDCYNVAIWIIGGDVHRHVVRVQLNICLIYEAMTGKRAMGTKMMTGITNSRDHILGATIKPVTHSTAN